MCSICGEVDFISPSDKRYDTVKKMNNVMKHRGPDDSDIFSDEKMQIAANLLLDGTSVTDTAIAVGFNNVSHFILLFERHYGITPHRYKKSAK